ncbi:MAG TPA: MnhB domain-containing protein [Thermomicrobiales bacterium]|nr:MnhB domain-containing protein [Thermomicrobiales bacterium]
MPMANYRRNAGMLQSAARILLVPSFVIALAVMFKGYGDVGDGFSAGVIAALGALLQGLAFGAEELDRIPVIRYASIGTFVGLTIALGTAFFPLLTGDPILLHWPRAGEDVVHFGVLEFITPVLFDVGVFLVVYGFCVGAVHAIAREQERQVRDRERARKARGAERPTLAEEPLEVAE